MTAKQSKPAGSRRKNSTSPGKSGLAGISGIAEKGRQAPANVSGVTAVPGDPEHWPNARQIPDGKRANVGLQMPAQMYTRVKSHAFNGPPMERRISRYVYDGVRALEALEAGVVGDAGDGEARSLDPQQRDIPDLIADAIACLKKHEKWPEDAE